MSQTSDFIARYLNDARIASAELGFPVAAILAQWINETDSGGSPAFQQGWNFAGVSLNGQILSYPDESSGLNAYIQRWGDPVYQPTRDAIAAAGGVNANPFTAAQAIEASPWAASHYNYSALEGLIAHLNLSQYDDLGPVPIPPQIGVPGHQVGVTPGGSFTPVAADDCILKLPSGSLGPVSLGGQCLLHQSQGRALLGGVSLLGGALLILLGLGFVAIGGQVGRRVAALT